MEDEFEQQLKELFEASGWRFEPHHDHPLVAAHGADRYAIEVKVAKESRRQLLEGLLASAILRARAGAIAANAKPLAVVCAPSLSDGLLKDLEQFVRKFGEGVGWGALDRSGLAIFHAPGLEDVRSERRHVPRDSALAHRADLFSDLGQWMLKVLLSHRLPPELRLSSPLENAKIDRAVSSAMSLSRLASVSVASAARVLASLKEESFAIDGPVLQLIRERELLDRWSAAHRKRPRELRARWLFQQRDVQGQLDDVLRKHVQKPGERACLGLFAACDRLGFRFVSGVAPHLYLENVSSSFMQKLGLRLAEPGEHADVFVREPRFPESVFRGSSERDGVQVADVLQCWIDASEHPARGEEMAAHLFEKVIGPCVVEHR